MPPAEPGAAAPDHSLEPLGVADLTMLASDCGPAPMHIAAILLVDGADDGTTRVVDALVDRARGVPRLVQVLVGPRRRPSWTVDDDADPGRHVTVRVLPGGGERAVLDDAADLVCAPLDRRRPLWSARWLTGWDATPARRGALVMVLHHVLADGLGGLGVLAALADPEPADDAAAPRPLEAPRAARSALAWLHGLLELLGGGSPHLAARTSLNRATGPTRRLHVARVPLAAFREGAQRHGGSINDAMVAAVVGALADLLAARGEHPRRLVVSVPVTARRTDDRRAGNDNGVLPVSVPVALDRAARVRHVAAATARRKDRPRGRSALPLSAAFRRLAAVVPVVRRAPAPGPHVRDERARPRAPAAHRRSRGQRAGAGRGEPRQRRGVLRGALLRRRAGGHGRHRPRRRAGRRGARGAAHRRAAGLRRRRQDAAVVEAACGRSPRASRPSRRSLWPCPRRAPC